MFLRIDHNIKLINSEDFKISLGQFQSLQFFLCEDRYSTKKMQI